MSEERNNLNQDELEQTRRGLFIQELLDSGKTYRQVEAMTGISKSTLIRSRKRA